MLSWFINWLLACGLGMPTCISTHIVEVAEFYQSYWWQENIVRLQGDIVAYSGGISTRGVPFTLADQQVYYHLAIIEVIIGN